jgi:hypothetical protein
VRTLIGGPALCTARRCRADLDRRVLELERTIAAVDDAKSPKQCRRKVAAARRLAKRFVLTVDALSRRGKLKPADRGKRLVAETIRLRDRAAQLVRFCG